MMNEENKSTTAPRKMDKRLRFFLPIIVIVHIVAFYTLWHYGLKWLLFSYLFVIPLGLGVALSLHRYFTHHAFKTGPVFEIVLLCLANTTGFKTIQWVSNHRLHHVFSDTPNDIHSPLYGGWWWAHFKWAFYEVPIRQESVQDLLSNPRVVWFNKFWWLPMLVHASLIVLPFSIYFGFSGFILGICAYCLTLTLAWHIEGSINSLTHLWGSRPFNTRDNSRNNLILALVAFGEGWHNNHHYYPTSARAGFYWYQLDVVYLLICLLEKCGIVWDVKRPNLSNN